MLPEVLEAKVMVGRPGLPWHENQAETTHVESLLIPRLDEGSIPSSSTKSASYADMSDTFATSGGVAHYFYYIV